MKCKFTHHNRCRGDDSRADTIYSDEATTLVQRMAAVGMSKEAAIWLMELCGVERVKHQLDRLPHYLRAAIEEDWKAPASAQTIFFDTKEGT